MSYEQQVDAIGAADYLGLTMPTLRRRIRAGTFPPPDSTQGGGEWWSIETLDKYRRRLARKSRKSR